MSELNFSHLFDAFTKSVASYGPQPAIAYKDHQSYQTLTYNELNQKVIQFGNLLKAVGVRPQDKVAIILPNGPEYAVSFWGVMYASATAVPLDNQFSALQVQNILGHCGAKILITTQAIVEKVKKDSWPGQTIIVDSTAFQEQIKSVHADSQFVPNLFKDPLAVIFYTSGTTDLPKGVMLTHENLLANAASIRELHLVKAGDGVIAFLPLHHAYAFTVTLLTPLFNGARIVYPPSLNSADLLACLREQKIAIFVGVPQVFSMIHRAIDAKIKKMSFGKRSLIKLLSEILFGIRTISGVNLNKGVFKEMHQAFGSDLRFLISGGARLDPDITRDFFKWGFTVLEGYGLTETSPVASFNRPDKPKIGSVGQPLHNVEIKIMEPNEKGIGEVAIRGANVMKGYYEMPEQTKAVLKDGWFYTGDLGVFDAQGNLRLVGRKKELIVLSNGENINPEEVEKHYAQNSYIKEIAVLPTQSKGTIKGVEQLGAVVVVDEDQFKANNEINVYEKLKWQLETLSAQLKSYQRISGFVISKDNLPRTRLGKIMRYQLPQLYNNLDKRQPNVITDTSVEESVSNEISIDETTRLALAQLEEIVGKKVALKDHLELDLGLDSLTRIELLLSLQERLKFTLSDDESMDFYLCQRVEELVDQLKKFVSKKNTQAKASNAPQWKDILKEPAAKETLDKIQLNFSWWEVAFNLIIITFFKIIFKIFFLLKVEGRNNLPKDGPYLICPNHTNYLDGLIIFSALPYKLIFKTYFVGHSNFFETRILGPFMKIGRLISIEVSYNLTEAFKACAYVFQSSKIVCFFPEGQRSIDGELNEFKKGIGILIKELNVPVVPVYIEGAFKVWPRGQKFPKLGRIKVNFGVILTPNSLEADISVEQNPEVYKLIAQNLQEKVQKMM